MSFIFTTLVIFEVALLFVVDGFELMVHPCQDHGEFYCHRKSIVTAVQILYINPFPCKVYWHH